MEALVEILLEVFGELILELIFSALTEVGLHLVRDPGREPVRRSPWMLVTGYVCLGILVGAVSLYFFRHSFMHTPFTRLANLVLAPVAGGLGMALMGAWRQRRGQQTIAIDRFAYGYLFGLAYAWVRFTWAV